MEEMLRISAETWQSYWGKGYGSILTAVSFLYLLLFPGERKNRKALAGYTVVFLFLYFFPYTAKVISACIGEMVYWRVLWLLPAMFLIAAACTSFVQKFQGGFANGFIVALLAVAIVFCGRNVYFHGAYELSANAEEVPEQVERICDLLRQDQPDGEIRMATTESIATYVRVYDAGIRMPYGRGGKGAGGWYKRTLYENIMAPDVNVKMVIYCGKKGGWKYLVPELRDSSKVQIFLNYGYECLGNVDDYYIFRDPSI